MVTPVGFTSFWRGFEPLWFQLLSYGIAGGTPLSKRFLAHSLTGFPAAFAARSTVLRSSGERRIGNATRVLFFGSFGRPRLGFEFILRSTKIIIDAGRIFPDDGNHKQDL